MKGYTSMKDRKKFIINFLYFAIILAIAFILIKYALPQLAPFVIAFFIAYLLKHPIQFISRKLGVPRRLCAVILVLIFYGTIGILVALLTIKALSSISTLLPNLPMLFRLYIEPVFTQLFRELETAVGQLDPALLTAVEYMQDQFMNTLGQLVSNLSMSSMEFVSNVASSLPMLFIRLVLMIISTFFIAMDYEKLTRFCLGQLNAPALEVFLQIKQYMIGTLFVCIRSYLLIMTITFIELSIALSVIGVRQALLIAFCTAVFDILPVLGTGGIMIPWAIITAVLGNYPLAVKLFIVYIIITIIRNIIEPKIVGKQLGLHPVVTLASMFAGAQLLGAVGLFGFPILLSLMRYLNSKGTLHFYNDKPESLSPEKEETPPDL